MFHHLPGCKSMEHATENILNCAKRTFKKGSKSHPDTALLLKESTKLSVMDSRTNNPFCSSLIHRFIVGHPHNKLKSVKF